MLNRTKTAYLRTCKQKRWQKRLDRERSDKDLHGKDYSRHQRNNLIRKAKENDYETTEI